MTKKIGDKEQENLYHRDHFQKGFDCNLVKKQFYVKMNETSEKIIGEFVLSFFN